MVVFVLFWTLTLWLLIISSIFVLVLYEFFLGKLAMILKNFISKKKLNWMVFISWHSLAISCYEMSDIKCKCRPRQTCRSPCYTLPYHERLFGISSKNCYRKWIVLWLTASRPDRHCIIKCSWCKSWHFGTSTCRCFDLLCITKRVTRLEANDGERHNTEVKPSLSYFNLNFRVFSERLG